MLFLCPLVLLPSVFIRKEGSGLESRRKFLVQCAGDLFSAFFTPSPNPRGEWVPPPREFTNKVCLSDGQETYPPDTLPPSVPALRLVLRFLPIPSFFFVGPPPTKEGRLGFGFSARGQPLGVNAASGGAVHWPLYPLGNSNFAVCLVARSVMHFCSQDT